MPLKKEHNFNLEMTCLNFLWFSSTISHYNRHSMLLRNLPGLWSHLSRVTGYNAIYLMPNTKCMGNFWHQLGLGCLIKGPKLSYSLTITQYPNNIHILVQIIINSHILITYFKSHQYFIELHLQSYNLGKVSRLHNLAQDFFEFRTLRPNNVAHCMCLFTREHNNGNCGF